MRGVQAIAVRKNVLEFRKGGKTIQRIDLGSRGTDGMSDKVYPYKGTLISESVEGGCAPMR